ncbi:DUF871 domain-containing protein [Collinsella intestinalis]|uniref:DUF871 domain-containing protein n=1 Tax=Collinsella intestinalis TaxID=147207 RepID=UPI0022DFD2B9|nr:MupG family TIM beta-alpha barrel fold protein [Collinsella intestinalis]
MKILTSERSGVCRLGISLYPEFASQEDNFAYLRRAAEHGFDVLFLALLGAKGTYEEVVERYLPYTRLAHELGFEIFCDVNPMVLKRLGVGISMFQGGIDLAFFKELGIDAMRLDLGMSDLEEAALAKNADGIKICINGAAVTDHVGALLSCGAPREALVGCHNYYPHRYTGVSLDYFMRGTEHWAKRGMRLQAFVSSNAPEAFGPWPVTEGLPTLEMHRDLPTEVQLKHFVMMGCVGDVLIGNCFATDDELAAMERANSDRVRFTTRLVDGLPQDMARRLGMNLSVRGDCTSGYMIRTLESRMDPAPVEPFNTVDIERGDVIIDNRLYGQYAGEVQIALAPMKNSGKTNVVGHIDDCEHVLLDYLAAGTRFAFDIVG